jgi:hypothetical protein
MSRKKREWTGCYECGCKRDGDVESCAALETRCSDYEKAVREISGLDIGLSLSIAQTIAETALGFVEEE